MASREELVEQLKTKGIEADPTAHPATLAKMLKDADKESGTPPVEPVTSTSPTTSPAPSSSTPTEGYVKISDVKQMISDALAQQKTDSAKPIKLKKITEHTAHVWRFDEKWVVDFKDRNSDPYKKEKVHAYNRFNEQQRIFQAWIELVFDDGSTKDIPLTTYLEHRFPIYCPIIKRHIIDKSYVAGEVEQKKEVGDKLVGTGKMIDQDVTMYSEVFEVKTPDGVIRMIPDYAIC